MRLLEIRVLPGVQRIRLKVEMPDPQKRLTSQVPHLPKRLFQLMPRLSKHTCHNDAGLTFRQECLNTEIPHLFEHLIIELQLQARQDPTDHLRGETEWNWTTDPQGHYFVTVEYDNALLAFGAIQLAVRILTELDRRDISIDIHAEIARLRTLALIGDDLAATPIASPAASKETHRRPLGLPVRVHTEAF